MYNNVSKTDIFGRQRKTEKKREKEREKGGGGLGAENLQNLNNFTKECSIKESE